MPASDEQEGGQAMLHDFLASTGSSLLVFYF